MSKKKKIILTVITILIIIIISFILPVKREEHYKYGKRQKFEEGMIKPVTPENWDYTIFTYKNIYGITIHTRYKDGIAYY